MAATLHDPSQPPAAWFSLCFVNDGGPLIILPDELLTYWEGSDRPADGRIIQTSIDDALGEELAGTDYRRAWAAGSIVSVIPVGPGFGVVLGAHQSVCEVRWLRLTDSPGVLVTLPIYAEMNAEPFLIEALRRSPEIDWQIIFPAFRTVSGRLCLLHAINPGSDVVEVHDEPVACMGFTIPCQIEPGSYVVELRRIVLDTSPGKSLFFVCRLRPTEC
jgi:hypothetical protein